MGATRAIIDALTGVGVVAIIYSIQLKISDPLLSMARGVATSSQLDVISSIEYALTHWPLVAVMAWFLYVFVISFKREPISRVR